MFTRSLRVRGMACLCMSRKKKDMDDLLNLRVRVCRAAVYCGQKRRMCWGVSD